MRVHTIDLEFQGLPGVIASYLIEGDGGVFLVETGPESTRRVLESKLKDLGYTPADLDAVFVTHIHLDHAGAAGAFAAVGVPVYVHPKGSKHLIDPTRLIESARMVYGEEFDELWGEMTPAPAANVHEMRDGEIVEIAGIPVQAIETPGHAFHHHAYLVGANAVFAGDAAGARLEGAAYTSVTSAPPQFHLEHSLASIDKIVKINSLDLYLTHFGKVDEPVGHLSDYLDAVELNAIFVLQRIEEGMGVDALKIAYQAFQMEQAFRAGLPRESWARYQAVNGTDMCADGIRLYWEKKASEGA